MCQKKKDITTYLDYTHKTIVSYTFQKKQTVEFIYTK